MCAVIVKPLWLVACCSLLSILQLGSPRFLKHLQGSWKSQVGRSGRHFWHSRGQGNDYRSEQEQVDDQKTAFVECGFVLISIKCICFPAGPNRNSHDKGEQTLLGEWIDD